MNEKCQNNPIADKASTRKKMRKAVMMSLLNFQFVFQQFSADLFDVLEIFKFIFTAQFTRILKIWDLGSAIPEISHWFSLDLLSCKIQIIFFKHFFAR